ncbi:MAG: hypothetical protein HN929_00240 [Chloroflexi bacterium]|jgi:hypothetical protein|nr:hypothetical protein [Chloroflexota bacterium]MBT7079900.1 hypothetical protein [Chloroflexota bacterium]
MAFLLGDTIVFNEQAPPVGDTTVLTILFFLYVFGASCGVLQLVGAYSRMAGISFFKRPAYGYVFGGAAILGMNLMFFLSGNRNVIEPRLEGAQLFGGTLAGLAVAVAVTLAVAHFIRRKEISVDADTDPVEGFQALQKQTYLPIIKRVWHRLKNKDSQV